MADPKQLTGEIKELTGAQRLSLGVANIMAHTSLGRYRNPEDLQFALVCKLADYFKQVVVGFDENAFFKASGYANRVK